MRNKLNLAFSVLAIAGLFYLPGSVLAAASFTLSPSTASPGMGQSFLVSVNINTGGEPVNAVEVTLSFPADKLKANSIGGGAFDVNAESSIASGTVRISKGKLPPAVVGSARIATVSFTALSTGTATISASGLVLRESDSSNILGSGAAAAVNIGSAVVPSDQTDLSTQPGSSQEAQSSLPPVISDVEVLNLGAQTATIKWKTDKSADSEVEYGFVTNRASEAINYFFTSQSEKMVGDHELIIDPKTLIPGHLYHFRVSSKDAEGNQAQSEDKTFLVPGYSLKVVVVDDQSKKVAGIKVKLDSLALEGYTDQNGEVVFTNLPLGKIPVSVDGEKISEDKEADIVADQNQLSIVLAKRVKKIEPLVIIEAILGIVILLLVILAFLAWKKKIKLPFIKGDPPIHTPPGTGGYKP